MSPALGSQIKQWWLTALLVAGLVLFFASGAHRAISWQTIALHYGQITAYTEAHLALAAASFLLLYAVAVAFSLPVALPLTLTGGAIFGWLAVLLVLVGATAGAGVVFIAARTAFADLARRRAGPFMARLEDGFSRNAFFYLLALRLIPAAPFWVVNIVPALTRMPFRSYLAATFIGIAPGSAVFVSVGRGLDHVLAAGRT
ncbi:MAG: TVP38/TMEM64 family protein, partial [Candidatus Puniceispirillaceae bacterium]